MEKITNQQAYEETLHYFKGDDLAARVWVTKYALKDSDGNIYEKTPDDMHHRIASEIARIEKKYPNPLSEAEIFDLIKDFKYIIPQGSPMTGIGNNFQIASLSNCFVIGNGTNSDSYGSIMKIDEEQVQLMKRRGGVGHDLSYIRPKGSAVKNSALTSTGLAPFMERYSNSTREVAQDGRRGALMLSVSINHPDSEDFINAKLEQGKVTGANISVKIDDEFMKAVKTNSEYQQKYPIYSKNPKYTKTIFADEIWKKIVHNAWKSAEPGILFWDTIIRESIPDCYADLGFETVSTNPCLTGDTWIMTKNGAKRIYDLVGKKYFAWVDGNLFPSTDEGFFKTGFKPIFEITTKRGLKLKGTDNHLIKKLNSKKRQEKTFDWIELGNLKKGDKISINNNRNVKNFDGDFKLNFEKGWLVGNLLGDGTFDGNTAILRFWGENNAQMKEIAVKYLENNVKHRSDLGSGNDKKIISIKSKGLYELCEEINFDKSKKISDAIEKTDYQFYRGFFSGWFDADGTVLNNTEKGISVRLSSSDLYNLEIAQRMLLRLGIFSTVSKLRRESQEKLLPDGKGGLKSYKIKDQHELIISKDNVLIFRDLINFKDEFKKSKLETAIASLNKRGLYKETFLDEVLDIKYCGEEEVFDCQIMGANEFDANGINVHNCGEIPLCPYDSCRLIAINLYSYVENPFTKKAKFNFELFKKHAGFAQRMMDDIIDLEMEKIDAILAKIEKDPENEEIKHTEKQLWEKIRKKTLQGRRTGVGITAEGDMLAALNLRYGSKEANEFSVEVHKTLALSAYRSSVEMAKERGAFEVFNAEKEKNNPFILRLKEADENLYQDMVKYGRRNIALLTIAPTGSTSLMSQTTSGIEPVFLPVYKRRRKVNPNDKDVRVDFVDEVGDSWEEYIVFHHHFKTWMEVNGYDISKNYSNEEIQDLIEKSPYYKATSNDIDWLSKVEMQGAIQKWVDHSISVTINIPNEATEELVNQLYIKAWEVGCKGVTVYRDGSRSGVLVAADDKKEEKDEEEATSSLEAFPTKRPQILEADVVRFQNNKEKWIAFVGLVNGRPYEIFTGLADDEEGIMLPRWVNEGLIIKNRDENGVSRYDFQFKNLRGYKTTIEGLSHKFNPEFWNYAKLISGTLRHGMPIENVVELINRLELDSESINTWKAGVARALKRYIPDGTEVDGHKCSNCGSDQVVYQEGCLICKNCGNSKCG